MARNAQGNLLMECVLKTEAGTIVEFIQGLQGTLMLTFEEGTWAAWLHDLLRPHVSRLVVCDPRKAALLKEQRFAAAYWSNSRGRVSELLEQHTAEREFVGNGLPS